MDHVFLMLEVTPLSSVSGKLCRIAALRTDEKGNQLAAYDKIFEPSNEKDVLRPILIELQNIILASHLGDKYIIVSYFGQDFYREVLHKACKVANVEKLFTRSWIGVEQLAWPYAFDKKLRDRKLETLGAFLSIPDRDPLWILVSCYWTLMRRITTGILLEEQARTHGGPVFEMAQKLVRRF